LLYFFLTLGVSLGWVVNTTPRPLYPGPSTHCTGGWAGPRVRKISPPSPHRDLNLEPSSPQRVTLLTVLLYSIRKQSCIPSLKKKVSPTDPSPHPAYFPPITYQSSSRSINEISSDNHVINFASGKLAGTDQDVWTQTELR
jgi:hypothetical protein